VAVGLVIFLAWFSQYPNVSKDASIRWMLWINSAATIPPAVVQNATVLVSSYDGLTDRFLCYKGQWLVSSSE
jgi:hypothetical protein